MWWLDLSTQNIPIILLEKFMIHIISKIASYIVTSTFSRKLKCSAVFMFAGKLYGNNFLSLPHCSDVVGCGAGLLLSLVLPLSMLQGKGLVWIAAVLYNLLHATPWVSWCLPCSSSGVVHCRHTWWTGQSRIGTAITTGHGCISKNTPYQIKQ